MAMKLRNNKADRGTNIEEHATAQKATNNNRNITILEDSIIKEMKAFKMKQGISQKDKVYIKSFPGATVECMTDPSMEFKSDTILLHCGTNDLRTEKSTEEISLSVIKYAKKINSNVNEVIVSGIIARTCFLKLKCNENSLLCCDNGNISKTYHLKTNAVAFKLKWNNRTCKQLFKMF